MTKIFEKYCPIQAKNIGACGQLSKEKKMEFEAHMAMLADDASETLVKSHAEEDFFFKAENQLLGQSKGLGTGEKVGRLHPWSAMETAARAIVPREFFERSRTRYFDGESEVVEELADSLDSVAMKPIVWGFVFSIASSAIKSSDLPLLPCRLGLDDLKPNTYLRLELKVPRGVEAKQPTGFDAGLNPYWRPGGATFPRDACRGKSGFPEVVLPGRTITCPNGLTYGQIGTLEIAS